MILKDPYSFKTLKLHHNSQIVSNINKYITIDYAYIKQKEKIKLKNFTDTYINLNPVILYGISDVEKDIPIFNHPIINTQNNWIALDLRPYVKLTEDKLNYEVKNDSEYSLTIQRFILSGMWYVNKQSNIYSLKLGHFAFASWLSDNLTRKFGLDLNNQLQLRILGLIYYSHLFTDIYTEDDFTKLVIRCKEDVLVPKIIEEIKESIKSPLESIDDFCKACYEVTDNIRLKDLDYTVLVNILSNNWMGSNGKELVVLSLEHPPTWLSLVYSSLTQRSFKKNFISTIVEKLNKRGKGEEFLDTYNAITYEYIQEK